jgi:hypothetical protein
MTLGIAAKAGVRENLAPIAAISPQTLPSLE